MAVIDTTNVIDNSIYLKASLKGNMVGDNYYIENLQDKRDEEWEYRYNRVDIEEELKKQIAYTKENPNYTPIEAVITNVKSDKGKDMGTDWAHLAFRDLKHYNNEGSRYRFGLDFPDMKGMTEDDKHYKTSIWICVNKSPIKAGNSCTVRRCDSVMAFEGYPNRDKRKKSKREIHYEPVILENDLKYLQVYYNLAAPVPQSEWYAVAQLNYFSNCVKINDRILFGTMDTEVRENNAAYKVKAVIKPSTDHTFIRDAEDELESTNLVVFALDKDAVAPKDNFQTRVASGAPVYNIPVNNTIEKFEVPPVTDGETHEEKIYEAHDVGVIQPVIHLGKYADYEIAILCNDKELERPDIGYTVCLDGVPASEWNQYFMYEQTGYTSFRVYNLKTCTKGRLIVDATFVIPENGEKITREYKIELGRVY